MFFQNVYDEAPVEDILPETMEAFLDEFCLTSQGDLTNKDFKASPFHLWDLLGENQVRRTGIRTQKITLKIPKTVRSKLARLKNHAQTSTYPPTMF